MCFVNKYEKKASAIIALFLYDKFNINSAKLNK